MGRDLEQVNAGTGGGFPCTRPSAPPPPGGGPFLVWAAGAHRDGPLPIRVPVERRHHGVGCRPTPQRVEQQGEHAVLEDIGEIAGMKTVSITEHV